jgi:hypothetical protein
MISDVPDISVRATIDDQTAKGAKSAVGNIKSIEEQLAISNARIDKFMADARRRQQGGRHGGGNHFGRIFSDQSTTGLNPLQRGLAGALSEHLGTGLGIGALAVAGKAMLDLTEQAQHFKELMLSDQLNAAGMAVELGKAVPLLGSFVAAGQNIRELFTGERAELERQKEVLAQINALQDKRFALAIRTKEEELSRAVEIRRIEQATSGVGLRGADVTRKGFQSELANASEDAQKKILAAQDRLRLDPDIAAAQKAFADFSGAHGARIAALQNRVTSGGETASEKDKAELQSLTEQSEALRLERDKLTKSRSDASAKAVADAKAEQAATNANVAARQRDFELVRRRELALEAQRSVADVARRGGATEAERLETGGNVNASRRKSIAVQVESDIASARMEAQAKIDSAAANERIALREQLNRKIYAIEQQGDADLQRLEKETNLARIRAGFDGAEAIAYAKAAQRAQSLREAGLGYDAELVLLKRSHASRLAEIDQQAAEEIARNRDNAANIQAKAQAQKDQENVGFREQQRQQREGRIGGTVGTARELLSGQAAALEIEARAGNTVAAVEAKRLQIAGKYFEKRAELNRLIRDPNVNQIEKNLAQQQLAGLGAQQKRELELGFLRGPSALPSLSISALNSGYAARANEEHSTEQQLITLMRDNTKSAGTVVAETRRLVEALKQNPIIRPMLGGRK